MYHLIASNLEQARRKKDNRVPVLDQKLHEDNSVLLKDHTTGVWDRRYIGDYRVVSFHGKTQVEVVNSTGTVVKYMLPADQVISKLPDYQCFGRQLKLRIDPKNIPNLKR